MIEGVSHITLIVKDLERTAVLLKEVLDAREVYSSGDETYSLSKEKFFIVGGTWIAVMEGAPLAEHSYNHIAFKIPDEEFAEYAARVEASGAEILPGRGRTEGEGSSVYFYDWDNHLFELHTGTLPQRLASYGVKSDSYDT